MQPNPVYPVSQYQGNAFQTALFRDLNNFVQAIVTLWKNTADVNLSNSAVYNESTGVLTVPPNETVETTYNLTADLYSDATTYTAGMMVLSSGSDGGEQGRFYKSLTPDTYDVGTSYDAGEIVTGDGTHGSVAGVLYISQQNFNKANDLNDLDWWHVVTNLDQGLDNTYFWSQAGSAGILSVNNVYGTNPLYSCIFQSFIANSIFTFTSSSIGSLVAGEIINEYGGSRNILGNAIRPDFIKYNTDENGVLYQINYMQYTD
jgi:hypothetical protein